MQWNIMEHHNLKMTPFWEKSYQFMLHPHVPQGNDRILPVDVLICFDMACSQATFLFYHVLSILFPLH